MARQKFEGMRSQAAIRLTAQPADGNTITITPASGTPRTYEFDSAGGVTPGNITVTIGASTALTLAALVAAINANKPVPAISAYVDPIDNQVARLEADAIGDAGNHALAAVGANIVLSGAAMTNGENSLNQVEARGEYTVTALDVTAGNIMLSTGLGSPRFAEVVCRSSTGLLKTLTSLITIDGTRVKVDFDGVTNPAAGDKLTFAAWE